MNGSSSSPERMVFDDGSDSSEDAGVPAGADDETARQALRLAALSKLLELELEDLALVGSPTARRFGDNFGGLHQEVSQQFMVDAHRANYRVDEVDFCFSGDPTAFGDGRRSVCDAGAPDDADADDVTPPAHARRLAHAVRSCLGASGAAAQDRVVLMRLATTLLSQAGLALVGMACRGAPQLALSGGDRAILYDLRRAAANGHPAEDGPWEVRICFRATGFGEYLQAGSRMEAPCPCSTESGLERGCTVRLWLDAKLASGVAFEVSDLVDRLDLLDLDGVPIQLLNSDDLEGSRRSSKPASLQGDAEEGGSWWALVPGLPSVPDVRGLLFSGSAEAQPDEAAAYEGERAVGAAPNENAEEVSVWEWDTLLLSPVPNEEDVLLAWYGHPSDANRRLDITQDVRDMVAAARAGKAALPIQDDSKAGEHGQHEVIGGEVAISTSFLQWGDPARFVWKRLSVTLRREPGCMQKGLCGRLGQEVCNCCSLRERQLR